MTEASALEQQLPYRIELYQTAAPHCLERVLARACHAPIADAMFEVASREHPGHRIALYRGGEVIRARAAPGSVVRGGSDHRLAGARAAPRSEEPEQAPRQDRPATRPKPKDA
jgi:hypothetical protein